MAKAAPNPRAGSRHEGIAPARPQQRRAQGRERQARSLALIGDVHANLQALDAVLADIEKRGIDEVWNVGDLIGYGGSPQEVVDLLRKSGVSSILGNIDEKVLRLGSRRRRSDSAGSAKKLTFYWTYGKLSPESRKYLRNLPRQAKLDVLGKSILLVHGSPESIEEYIEPGTSELRLRELADRWKADAIVAGHAHKPFVKKVGDTLFVNTGSVGRPESPGGRSCYAIMTVTQRGIRVRHVRPRYDVHGATRAIIQAGLPKEYARMIVTGRKFEDLPPAPSEVDRSRSRNLRSPDFILRRVRQLERKVGWDVSHSRHVTRLALSLFDQLAAVHALSDRERLLLLCAGLLHDIDWAKGQRGHHKESMRAILAADLGLSQRERLIVANTARYHRRALPARRHRNYQRLAEQDKSVVRLLGGLLRLADGLDCRHLSTVRSVDVHATKRRLTLVCRTAGAANSEMVAAAGKSDLLRDATGRAVTIELTQPLSLAKS